MVLFTQDYIEKKGLVFALMPLSIYMLLMGVLVYGHTAVLIPKFFEKKAYVMYAGGLILLIAAYTFLESVNQAFWSGIVYPEYGGSVSSYMVWNGFYAFCFVLNSTLLYFTQQWAEQRQQVDNIQIAQLETELKYLRAQINPHFLFNGLNTIYGTIDNENRKARDMVVQFSDLLRYNLYEANSDTIEIGKEIVYLENYVALQQARSNEGFVIRLTIEVADRSTMIAPLLFVPFMENAFKYAARDSVDNRIDISLRQTGRQITFECQNAYKDHPRKSGIGLTNVTRRLDLLYKGRYTLTIHSEEGKYLVILIINL